MFLWWFQEVVQQMIYSFEKRGNGGLGSGLDTFIEEDPCISSWQWKLFFVGHIVRPRFWKMEACNSQHVENYRLYMIYNYIYIHTLIIYIICILTTWRWLIRHIDFPNPALCRIACCHLGWSVLLASSSVKRQALVATLNSLINKMIIG